VVAVEALVTATADTEARVSATAITALDANDDAPYAVLLTSNIQHPVSGQGGLLLM
jgi:hypothetical protein